MKKSFSSLFSESWNEYKSNYKIFLVLFILLSFIPNLILSFLSIPLRLQILKLGESPNVSELFSVFLNLKYTLPLFIAFIITLILGLIITPSLFYNSLYRKKTMGVKETIKGGKKYFWKYLLLQIVILALIIALILLSLIIIGISAFLGVYYKNILLIIALVILSILSIFFLMALAIRLGVYWILSPYIMIGKNKGVIDSLKESKNIIKGRWWRTLGFIILFSLISLAIYLGFSVISLLVNGVINPSYVIEKFSESPAYPGLTAIRILNENIEYLFGLVMNIILTPLGIIFFKNYYLDIKRNEK